MPFYIVGAFGRAICLAMIAVLLAAAGQTSVAWVAGGFLVLWTLYSFVSGIVAVPYNDIVGRSIPSGARSRMLAWRFFGGGVLALGVAAVVHHLLATETTLTAYAFTFLIAAVLMLASSVSFVSAGEPPVPPATTDRPRQFDLLSQGRSRRAAHRHSVSDLSLYPVARGCDVDGSAVLRRCSHPYRTRRGGRGDPPCGTDCRVARFQWPLGSHWRPLWEKLRLLQMVGVIRLAPPLGALAILAVGGTSWWITLSAFAALFVVIGALINGMTIGYLGYLMEASPDAKRPAYSAYFNALASPAALLPLAGAALADGVSLCNGLRGRDRGCHRAVMAVCAPRAVGGSLMWVGLRRGLRRVLDLDDPAGLAFSKTLVPRLGADPNRPP